MTSSTSRSAYPALLGTLRSPLTVGHHPKVPGWWNLTGGMIAHPKVLSGKQAELTGPRHRFGPVRGAELAEHVGDVLLDRVERHDQLAGGQRLGQALRRVGGLAGRRRGLWLAARAQHSGQVAGVDSGCARLARP